MRVLLILRTVRGRNEVKRIEKFFTKSELVEKVLHEGEYDVGGGRTVRIKRGELLLVSKPLSPSEIPKAFTKLDKRVWLVERKGLVRRKLTLITE
mgnify:CR=1 FL=1